MSSVFLDKPQSDWVAQNDLAFALRDAFPVSEGHTLVIPKRVVATWFDTRPEERAAIFALVDQVKRALDEELHPDGYNVGFNAGAAAGQTVMHLHVHVIPRFRGDVPDPTGGVRHVIPGKANYLAARAPALATGETSDPFLRHIEPLFARATDIAIVAAFVRQRGLALLRRSVQQALTRGAKIRIVTGDYLNYTEVEALRTLDGWAQAGTLQARVVAMADLTGPMPAFHPKSWRFEAKDLAVAFVGSSNISHSALQTGIEWNLRVERGRDKDAYAEVVEAFDALWNRARCLTEAWIADYERRIAATPTPVTLFAEEAKPLAVPSPHEIQQEALDALAQRRKEQRARALVVLATGLGKTWLAAFDAAAFSREARGGKLPRVLFVAHREELLAQAARTFGAMFPEAAGKIGYYVGDKAELGARFVFASVQKLVHNLEALDKEEFDYAIVDEVHHSTADSYQKVIARLHAGFLLGLTATPDRADGADVLGIFGEDVAYRADLGVGVERGRLVPFAYYGLKDGVDYSSFARKDFKAETLAKVIDAEDNRTRRMESLWKAWGEHPGVRTLVFCCNIAHADHARAFLELKGVRAASVHSGPTSADREETLKQLEEGTLDAVCAVDLFNEGVDVPLIDRVVMLRPSESPVIFLQQLGRGLRVAQGKTRLVVLDFVGNHAVFLERLRTLLSMAKKPMSLHELLESQDEAALSGGSVIDLELEAKRLLEHFLPKEQGKIERVFMEIFKAREERPTAGELFRMGYSPKELRKPKQDAGWFDFLLTKNALNEEEQRTLPVCGAWLRHIETTDVTKSFKMVTLQALLEAGALTTGMTVSELARRSHAILVQTPELFADIETVQNFADPRRPEDKKLVAHWKKHPIAAWTGSGWFALEGDRLVPKLPVPQGDEATLAAMTRELVDYRLAEYIARSRANKAVFEAEVIRMDGAPALKLPESSAVPSERTRVRVSDGSPLRFDFEEGLCRNVSGGKAENLLPALLGRWFGAKPEGRKVRFVREPGGIRVEPVGAKILDFRRPGMVTAHPRLAVAAGPKPAPTEGPEDSAVYLGVEDVTPEMFAVRATGDSMDGGKKPIRDGDWMVMKPLSGVGLEAVNGEVAAIQIEDAAGGFSYQVKRVVSEGSGWKLRSQNPERASFEGSDRTKPIAVLRRVVRPEDLAPPVGTVLDEAAMAERFGLEGPLRSARLDGHLFMMVEARERFVTRERLRWEVPDRRPGETAFVLARGPGDAWRYVGVARYLDSQGLWACPALDDAAWLALR